MRTIKLICAGFGGQGVLTIGQLVAMMGMKKDLLVSWMPSYGPEMRGGTANCHVIVSESQQSPLISNDMTHLVTMNKPSLDKYESSLSADCILISNTASKTHQNQFVFDFNQLASDMNNIKTANMIAFGALVATLKNFTLAEGEAVIREKLAFLDDELLNDNIKAFYLGAKLVDN